ncbi:MAG: DUF4442 domain-containing protein [Spirochaetia bacterium]|nr:DUF4442 domain-containing protein [Spirochaetia bacterium]
MSRGIDFQVAWQWRFFTRLLGRRGALNIYAPYRGAGIHVRTISKDFTRIEVELRMKLFNRNYVGTHFGGSLYAMCDPFYMFILIRKLGDDYIVWDKSAKIDFVKPGTGTVSAVFEIPDTRIEEIRLLVDNQRKTDVVFHTQVTDKDGRVVARVEKVLYVRRKRA